MLFNFTSSFFFDLALGFFKLNSSSLGAYYYSSSVKDSFGSNYAYFALYCLSYSSTISLAYVVISSINNYILNVFPLSSSIAFKSKFPFLSS